MDHVFFYTAGTLTSTPIGKHRIEPLDANVSFDGSVARWVFVFNINQLCFYLKMDGPPYTLSAQKEKVFSSWERTKIYCVYFVLN